MNRQLQKVICQPEKNVCSMLDLVSRMIEIRPASEMLCHYAKLLGAHEVTLTA